MKALVFEALNKMAWKEMPEPEIIDDTDVIVKVEGFTFSRQDFRPYLGQDATVAANRIMGHEAVGRIVEVGKGISKFKVNDRVVVNCMTRCGKCERCERDLTCNKAGFILGVKIDGTHAEFVRVPYGDYSMYKIDDDMSFDHAILLCDVLPTVYENIFKKVKVDAHTHLAIIGDGPIGMAALVFAHYFKAKSIVMFGHHFEKLSKAKHRGLTDFVQTDQPFMYMKKFNIVAECVGGSNGESFELAQEIIDEGGSIILNGVFSKPVQFNVDKLWHKDLTIKTGILSNTKTEEIIHLINTKAIVPDGIVSKTFKGNETIDAFNEVLKNRNLLKVAVNLQK